MDDTQIVMQAAIRAVMGLVMAVVCWVVARSKGYNPWCWLLATGCIGLVILAFLPNTKDPYAPRERRHAQRKRGNLIGIVLSVLGVSLLIVALFLI